MAKGWIKLHRSILENHLLMKDPEVLAIWIWLLLNAAHSDVRVAVPGGEYILKAGECMASRAEISEQTGVHQSKVQRTLSRLENEQMIEQRTDSRKRVISIVNWDRYQFTEHVHEQANEQVGEQVVNRSRTGDEQPTIYMKNEKNDNNYRNINAHAHARHADGVSINEDEKDFALRMAPEYREKLYRMREQIRRGQLEYAEYERGLNT